MNTRWAAIRIFSLAVITGTLLPAGALGVGEPEARPKVGLYADNAVRFPVDRQDATWHDAARDRDVPVRIYSPKSAGAQKFPVIVFSHGLGGSRANYGYFGQHMAEHGYIVIAPTHHGSDTQQLIEWLASHPQQRGQAIGIEGGKDGWLQSAISDPDNLKNRPKDISFVLDHIPSVPSLREIADTSRIGVAGHSFGAYTSMAVGGMTIDLPDAKGVSFRDPRVKAVLPMSPEGPGAMGITASSWDAFAVPVMFLTGTNDYGSGGRSAAWRRAAFEHVAGVDDYLIVLNGAGHMTFGNGAGEFAGANDKDDDATPAGPGRSRIRERIRERIGAAVGERKNGDPDQGLHIRMVNSISTAFFNAYLEDDAAARAWLKTYFDEKHDECSAEFKAGR